MPARAQKLLGSVATFIRGITFKPEDIVTLGSPDSVACMRTKNVQKELNTEDVWGISKSFVKRKEQFLRRGDILVSSANSWNLVGKCCWVPDLPWESTFGGFISVLRCTSDLVEPRFLYHWFASNQTQARVRSFGRKTTNISNLNFERCLKMPIYLPPISVQKHTIEMLDKCQSICEMRQTSLTQTNALTQSIFHEMFGGPIDILKKWPTGKLGDQLDFLTSGSRGWAKYYSAEGKLFLRIQNVKNDQLSLDDIARVSPPNTAEAKRTQVQAGDVLLSITADLGRTAVIPRGLETAFINQHLSILRTQKINPRFLSTYLSSPAGQRQIHGLNREGVKAGLNFDDIRSLIIPSPSPESQKEFAARAAQVDAVAEQQQKSLSELRGLLSSIQLNAFGQASP